MKSLVDIMGGTISVKSELGKGTEFIVDLYVPLAEAEVEEHSEENITENLMDARILLVEDSEINIYVAQLILEKAGCVVEIANGAYHCHDSGCLLRGHSKVPGVRDERPCGEASGCAGTAAPAAKADSAVGERDRGCCPMGKDVKPEYEQDKSFCEK